MHIDEPSCSKSCSKVKQHLGGHRLEALSDRQRFRAQRAPFTRPRPWELSTFKGHFEVNVSVNNIIHVQTPVALNFQRPSRGRTGAPQPDHGRQLLGAGVSGPASGGCPAGGPKHCSQGCLRIISRTYVSEFHSKRKKELHVQLESN